MEAVGRGWSVVRVGGRRLGIHTAAAERPRLLRAAHLYSTTRERDALAERFSSRTADLYARHGITNVGYWIPQQTDEELGIDADNTFIYIRGYPSKDERDKRLTSAHDDPEFGEIVISQERDPNRRLIVKAHNIDMVPSGPQTAIRITQ